MIKLLRNKEIDELKVCEMKDILQKTGGFYCLKNKQEYVGRLQNFKDVLNFSWREDQKQVIDEFLKFKKKYFSISDRFVTFIHQEYRLLMGDEEQACSLLVFLDCSNSP